MGNCGPSSIENWPWVPKKAEEDICGEGTPSFLFSTTSSESIIILKYKGHMIIAAPSLPQGWHEKTDNPL